MLNAPSGISSASLPIHWLGSLEMKSATKLCSVRYTPVNRTCALGGAVRVSDSCVGTGQYI